MAEAQRTAVRLPARHRSQRVGRVTRYLALSIQMAYASMSEMPGVKMTIAVLVDAIRISRSAASCRRFPTRPIRRGEAASAVTEWSQRSWRTRTTMPANGTVRQSSRGQVRSGTTPRERCREEDALQMPAPPANARPSSPRPSGARRSRGRGRSTPATASGLLSPTTDTCRRCRNCMMEQPSARMASRVRWRGRRRRNRARKSFRDAANIVSGACHPIVRTAHRRGSGLRGN